MGRKLGLAIATTSLAACIPALAQQSTAPPAYPQPTYQQPQSAYPQPSYQQQQPAYPQQPSYQQPPYQQQQPTYPSQPNYQQPAPTTSAPATNYGAQQPSYQTPAPNYQQQPPPRNYQQYPAAQSAAPNGYQQAPASGSYPAQPGVQSAAPSGYAPAAGGYQAQQSAQSYQAPRSYQQPAYQQAPPSTYPQSGYPTQSTYAPQAGYPAQSTYPQSTYPQSTYPSQSTYQAPRNYQQPSTYPQTGAGTYTSVPTVPASYPPPAGAALPAAAGVSAATAAGYQSQLAAAGVLVAPASQPGGAPQAGGTQPAAQAQTTTQATAQSYHTHQDTQYGHNHVYPDRGSVVHDAPHGAMVVNYAGESYRFADGVWYEPRGPAFVVVEPPVGLVVSTLPTFATQVAGGAGTYLYLNDTYYKARPELGGYEVINTPTDISQHAGTAEPQPGEPPIGSSIAIYPKNGQTSEVQARDHYECYRAAVEQTGYDPMRANSGDAPAKIAQLQSAYDHSQASCFEGRGYAVR
jgi:hypothetical protein